LRIHRRPPEITSEAVAAGGGAEPDDPVEPVDPVEPPDTVEPVDPVEPPDPVEPVESLEPFDPPMVGVAATVYPIELVAVWPSKLVAVTV
jgi:hypothetical protein